MRLAIVGCGLIGAKRAAAAKGHEIVTVCDIDPARREALARETSARPVADWREALAADIDAAVIATPHDSLAAIALAAVEAGRHVLIEKPGGRNAQEVRPVAEAARRLGVVAKVGFNHRFHPAIARARALAAEGAIGPIMFMRGRYGHGGRVGYEREWRFDPANFRRRRIDRPGFPSHRPGALVSRRLDCRLWRHGRTISGRARWTTIASLH